MRTIPVLANFAAETGKTQGALYPDAKAWKTSSFKDTFKQSGRKGQ